MKTLDDAVIELNGVLPSTSNQTVIAGNFFVMKMPISRNDETVGVFINNYGKIKLIGSVEQFQQRAKELGFINGYRYGVEYNTNGKRPDLPDDVVVKTNMSITADTVDVWIWCNIKSFKITDERYKPADTSYLEKPALEPVPEEEGWYDYDNQKSLRLPPVGDKSTSYLAGDYGWIGCEIAAYYGNGAIVAHNDGFTLVYKHELRPNNFHEHKAKAERKKVVNAAFDEAIKAGCVDFSQWLNHLYDKGFLKLPE